MPLPYLSVYTLSRQNRDRLSEDPTFAQQTFENLLGPSDSRKQNGKAWTQYNCPSNTCVGKNDYKLGVCFSGAAAGGYNCLRCGMKGRGFVSLCRQLYQDPGEFVDNSGSYVVPPVRKKIVEVREHPLGAKDFGRFWKWVYNESLKAYGPDGLLPEHRQSLEKRSLEISRLPFYFSMPPAETLERALIRHGPNVCEKAGIWDSEKESRKLFFEPGRMALIYPTVPWLERDVPFGYLRSYNPIAKTPVEKKFKLIGALGYHSNRNCYVRIDMDSRPQPLLISEAEIKVEAAWQAGTNGIGRPGINSGHEEIARIILKMLTLSEGKNPTRIVLCDDTEADAWHQQFVEINIHALASKIRQTISEEFNGYYIPINRVYLPSEPGVKCDIDDFISSLVAVYGLEEGRKRWTEWLYENIRKEGAFQIQSREELERRGISSSGGEKRT